MALTYGEMNTSPQQWDLGEVDLWGGHARLVFQAEADDPILPVRLFIGSQMAHLTASDIEMAALNGGLLSIQF